MQAKLWRFVAPFVLAYAAAARADYAFYPLAFPGAVETVVNSINDSGVIVGAYGDDVVAVPFPAGVQAFTFAGGEFASFAVDVPGAVSTEFTDVNNAGVIVGRYVDEAGVSHGFLKNGEEIEAVAFPAATATTPVGINDAGQLVGLYTTDPSGDLILGTRSFFFDGQAYHDVPISDVGASFLAGMSNPPTLDPETAPTIVGTGTWPADGIAGVSTQGFLRSDAGEALVAHPDSFDPLSNTPLTEFSNVSSDGRLVVGSYFSTSQSFERRGFVYRPDGETYEVLDYPGDQCTLFGALLGCNPSISAVNDAGALVGYYDAGDGDNVGFYALDDPLLGDANLDGTVSLADFNILKSGFGAAGDWLSGDFSGDAFVDLADFNLLKSHFGESASVPEPTAVMLVLSGLLGAAVFRRPR